MIIHLIDAKGSKYRDCSMISAMYKLVSEMKIGQSVVVDKVFSVCGYEEPSVAIRMTLNKIKKQDGISVVTKCNKANGSIMIVRVG